MTQSVDDAVATFDACKDTLRAMSMKGSRGIGTSGADMEAARLAAIAAKDAIVTLRSENAGLVEEINTKVGYVLPEPE